MTEYYDNFEKKLSIENIKIIKIKTDNLNINISESKDKDFTFRVNYDKTIYFQDENFFEGVAKSENEECLVLQIINDDLQNHNIRDAALHFCIPENIKVEIDSINSSVTGVDCPFVLSIHTINGDISLQHVSEGHIISENGKVTLKNVNHNFEIKTVNGDIFIQNAIGGVLNISTINADIKLLDISYNHIVCKNTAGDTQIELNKGSVENLEFVSEKGDISFAISNNSSESIALKTIIGNIKIYVPEGLLLNYDLTSKESEVSTNIDPEKAFEEIIDTNRFYVNFDPDITYIRAISTIGKIIVSDNKNGIQGVCMDPSKRSKKFVHKNSDDEELIITEIEDSLIGSNVKPEDKKNKQKYQNLFNKKNEDNIETLNFKTKLNFGYIQRKFSNIASKLFGQIKTEKKVEDNTAVIKILEMVESKKLSIEDAEKLIKSLTYKQ